MQKLSVVLSFIVLGSFVLFISSCDDDEPTKYQLSFSESTMTANEADLTIEIEVTLDKPAPEDITVTYDLTGTAFDNVRADTEEENPDYEVDGDYKEIEIKEGETSATILLVPYSDELIEDPETIEVTITEVDEDHVEFEPGSKVTITLEQEDGIAVLLEWPAAGTSGVADMDIIVRIGENTGTPDWDGILTGSAYRGFEGNFELVFLPKSFIGSFFGLGYTNTIYGMSYTYYDGTLNPLDFDVYFAEVINGEVEAEAQWQLFEQSYTADNINKWVSATPPTIIAQTFVLNNGAYSNFSEITKQPTSSRYGSATMNNTLTAIGQPKFTKSNPFKAHVLPEKYKTALGLK